MGCCFGFQAAVERTHFAPISLLQPMICVCKRFIVYLQARRRPVQCSDRTLSSMWRNRSNRRLGDAGRLSSDTYLRPATPTTGSLNLSEQNVTIVLECDIIGVVAV